MRNLFRRAAGAAIVAAAASCVTVPAFAYEVNESNSKNLTTVGYTAAVVDGTPVYAVKSKDNITSFKFDNHSVSRDMGQGSVIMAFTGNEQDVNNYFLTEFNTFNGLSGYLPGTFNLSKSMENRGVWIDYRTMSPTMSDLLSGYCAVEGSLDSTFQYMSVSDVGICYRDYGLSGQQKASMYVDVTISEVYVPCLCFETTINGYHMYGSSDNLVSFSGSLKDRTFKATYRLQSDFRNLSDFPKTATIDYIEVSQFYSQYSRKLSVERTNSLVLPSDKIEAKVTGVANFVNRTEVTFKPENVSDSTTGFQILRRDMKYSNNGWVIAGTVPVASTSRGVAYTFKDTFSGLKNGNKYVYSVRPVSGPKNIAEGKYVSNGIPTVRLTPVDFLTGTNGAEAKGNGKIFLRWSGNRAVDGYEIRIMKGSTVVKSYDRAGWDAVAKTFETGLSGQYDVQVRGYVKSDTGEKIYSSWSAKKAITIR